MRGRDGINDPDYSSQKTISLSAKIGYVGVQPTVLSLQKGSRGLSVTRCG